MDDKGRERASIFYKAAFYDRSAHMSLSCRFGVSFDYDRFDKENVGVANVTDGGQVVHTTEPIPCNGKESYDVSDKANKAAVEWLDKKEPPRLAEPRRLLGLDAEESGSILMV